MTDGTGVFTIVLAGGEGKRLAPLTADRAKPAVPFGGHYRLIDFALSNLVNANYRRIVVLTQYKSHSLDRHVSTTWRLSPLLGNYVAPVPAQMRRGPRWFVGSADAIYQNFNLSTTSARSTSSCSAPTTSTAWTRARWSSSTTTSGAAVTVAAIRAPIEQADQFGVIETGRRRPQDRRLPRKADGRQAAARRARPGLRLDGQLRLHDRGADGGGLRGCRRRGLQARHRRQHHPHARRPRRGRRLRLRANEVPGATDRDRSYWRDVGTLDAYYDAHMDLTSVEPDLQPLQPGVADPHLARPAPAGQVRLRRRGPPRARASTP